VIKPPITLYNNKQLQIQHCTNLGANLSFIKMYVQVSKIYLLFLCSVQPIVA